MNIFKTMAVKDLEVATRAIPVIDFGPAFRGDPGGLEAVAAEVRRASEQVGFFYLAGHGVPPEIVDAAESSLVANPGVKAVRSIRMRWIGHLLHADAELDVDSATSLADAHRIAHDAEHELIHSVPKLSSALIHAYPSHPNSGRQHEHTH